MTQLEIEQGGKDEWYQTTFRHVGCPAQGSKADYLMEFMVDLEAGAVLFCPYCGTKGVQPRAE